MLNHRLRSKTLKTPDLRKKKNRKALKTPDMGTKPQVYHHCLQHYSALLLFRNVDRDSYSFLLFLILTWSKFLWRNPLHMAKALTGSFTMPVFLTVLNTRTW